jgi:hypothetical protein
LLPPHAAVAVIAGLLISPNMANASEIIDQDNYNSSEYLKSPA